MYIDGSVMPVVIQGHLPEALKMYTVAAEAAHEQREIEHICLYEKGVFVYACAYVYVYMCVYARACMRVCVNVCACAHNY